MKMEVGLTFRNRNNHERDRDNQDLNEGDTLFVCRPCRVPSTELNKETNHKSRE